MPCVSDNGANAPISALTSASSLGQDRGRKTDDFGSRFVGFRAGSEAVVTPIDKRERQVRGAPSALAVQPPTKPRSFSAEAGARRRGPPTSGRTYMCPGWPGATETTSW